MDRSMNTEEAGGEERHIHGLHWCGRLLYWYRLRATRVQSLRAIRAQELSLGENLYYEVAH